MPINDARYYKTLLLCPTRQLAAELAPLLSLGLPLAPVHELPAFPNRREIADILKAFDAKLCFLDLSAPGNEGTRVLEDLHSLAPGLPVVVLLKGNNPDLILQCVRQGATDFLIHPFTPDQLDAAVEKIARMLPPPPSSAAGGKTIGVFPAKGAAGATTIACNLAFQAKRLGIKKILLADLDPLTGTVSFLLKLKGTYSFMDVVQRAGQLDADLWKQMVMTTGGIDVLLAPETPPDLVADLPTAMPVIAFAQELYDLIVVDCGSFYGPWNLSIARICNELLLVSTNEMASLQAALRVQAYFEQNRIDPARMKLVVNRYMKDHGLNSDSVPGVFASDAFQVLPSDADAVQKSTMEGKPMAPGSPFGKSLASLAGRLIEVNKAEPTGKRQKRTFFSLSL
jgi:pilus assembly protein CpaE